MKKQYASILMAPLLYLYMTSFAVAQWQSHATNLPEDLQTLFFTDCETGWVAGKDGNLKKTSNNGVNWTSLSSGTTKDINKIYFIDALTGWFVAEDGIIKKTTNGGTSWTSQYSGTTYELTDIHFIDAMTGFISGEEGILLKTTNGGDSWTNLPTVTSEDLKAVYAVTSTTVYACGKEGVLLKSTNGGTTWNQIDTQTDETLEDMYYTNGYVIACAKYGLTIKVALSGTVTQVLTGTSKDLNAIHFIEGTSKGWVVGEEGRAYYTINSGATWASKNVSTGSELVAVQFLSESCGYAADKDGRVYRLSGTLSVEDVSSAFISVFPNPVNDRLFIQGIENIRSISIYSNLGNKLIHVAGNVTEINLTELQQGTYFLQVEHEQGIYNQTILKQ